MMMSVRLVWVAAILSMGLAACGEEVATRPTSAPPGDVKWHPGHYVLVR